MNDKTIKLGCRNSVKNSNGKITKKNRNSNNHIVIIIIINEQQNQQTLTELYNIIFKTKYIEFENSAHTHLYTQKKKNWLRRKKLYYYMIYSNE